MVLGAGGAVGQSFHAGALAALADALGWDARTAEVVVGTSAGSLVGAVLRAGMPATDIAARACGDPVSPASADLATRLGAPVRVPPRDRSRGGPMLSPLPFLNAMRHPFQARLGALVGAALPPGPIPAEVIVAGIRRVHPDGWPDRPLWVCAVRRVDGRRVVFGRDPETEGVAVADAVAASCAVPGVFSPVVVAGVEHVDGGVHSPTNLDLCAGRGLDLVIVLSPMSATQLTTSLDGAVRGLCRLRLVEETLRVRRRGTPVVAIEPTPDDLAVMGPSAASMDGSRRRAVCRQVRGSVVARAEAGDLRQRLAALRG